MASNLVFRMYDMKADLEALKHRFEKKEKKPSTRKHPKPKKPQGRGFS